MTACAASQLTIRQAYDLLYQRWSPDLGDASRLRYSYDLARWELLTVDPFIADITTGHYQEFRLSSTYAGHSASTTETTLRTVRQTLRACHAFGLISSLPDAGRPRVVERPKPRPPVADEMGRLLRACRQAPWPGPTWWRAWLLTAYWTGLRLTDLTWRFGWEHVDFCEQAINFEAGKTKIQHRFPLHPALEAAWKPFRKRPLLFAVSRNPSRIRQSLLAIARSAGISRKLTTKSLRQAAITAWGMAHPECGRIVHGVGIPRVLQSYQDDLQILRQHMHKFPWPQESQPDAARQLLLF